MCIDMSLFFRWFLLYQPFPLPWHCNWTAEIVNKIFSCNFSCSIWVISKVLRRLKYAGTDFPFSTVFYYVNLINFVGKSWRCINISLPSVLACMLWRTTAATTTFVVLSKCKLIFEQKTLNIVAIMPNAFSVTRQ